MCAYIAIISMSLPGPVPDFGLGIMEKADSNLFDISWTGVTASKHTSRAACGSGGRAS